MITTSERREIRKIFKRNFGAAARLAEELGITSGAISLWFSGRTPSARLDEAMKERARELLREESARRLAEEQKEPICA
jgi:predicted transcriptional regulator